MYGFHESIQKHAEIFYPALEQAIKSVRTDAVQRHCRAQKAYADTYYSWAVRAKQWETWLNGIVLANEPKTLENL
jgi:hypothetical protein